MGLLAPTGISWLMALFISKVHDLSQAFEDVQVAVNYYCFSDYFRLALEAF
jgi:hypothetical protein